MGDNSCSLVTRFSIQKLSLMLNKFTDSLLILKLTVVKCQK